MNSERIKEIQEQTAYPESVSVKQALLQVWNESEQEQLLIQRVTPRFSRDDMWDAWWASAIKTISFSGVDKEYERRCFEKFYENKLSALNGG